MALTKNRRNLPLLFAAGAVCLLYGLGHAYIENHFSKPAAVICFIGLGCTLVCLLKLKKRAQRPTKAPQWRKYGFVVLVTVLLLALLVGVNYLAYRCNLRWDVTEAKQHTLAGSTIAIIEDLKAEVKIVAFYVGMPPKYLEDCLKEYERLSRGKIKAEIIDPIVEIGYAAQFGNVISGKERKVIVLSGSERRDIDFTDRSLSEKQLTNAIIRVTRDKRIIYFLTGHGEYDVLDDKDSGLSALKKLLVANNIEIRKLMLGIKKEIPDDCNVFIVAGPRDPLMEEEENIITAYLEKGGDALFLIENTPITTPDKPLTEEEKRKNPSLNGILNRWGIEIADDIVVDLSSHIGKDVGCPATRNYMPHKALVKNLDYTFYIRPRSISISEDHGESISVAPLVLTASEKDSWGESNRTLQIEFDEESDRPGPVTIASVVWEPKGENKLSDTRIIVFTDADFLSNAFIGKYSNAAMGLNVINWLLESEYQVFIDHKEVEIKRLNLTSRQKRMVAVVLFIIPILIAVAGVMTWLKQEHRAI